MKRIPKLAAASLALLMAGTSYSGACSRITYTGLEGMVVSGRSMDWMTDIRTSLWAFPAGVLRHGAAKENSLTWSAKYGSVIAAAYDSFTTDGINEKGLVANLLYLEGALYGERDKKRPGLSLAGWAQYVLDNFATVAETVEALRAERFQLVAPVLPGGYPAVVHLAVSDPTGDVAIFEYLGGKLVIHHGADHKVMTNEPSYDQQLALNAYWNEIGGNVMLPGTDRPADRFVRASYYLKQAQDTADERSAVAGVFSIMRNISVPKGDPVKANNKYLAPTLWRTVADQKHRTYYFESTTSPGIFWVELDKLTLKAGSPTKMLKVDDSIVRVGDAGAAFQDAPPFTFMPEKE